MFKKEKTLLEMLQIAGIKNTAGLIQEASVSMNLNERYFDDVEKFKDVQSIISIFEELIPILKSEFEQFSSIIHIEELDANSETWIRGCEQLLQKLSQDFSNIKESFVLSITESTELTNDWKNLKKKFFAKKIKTDNAIKAAKIHKGEKESQNVVEDMLELLIWTQQIFYEAQQFFTNQKLFAKTKEGQELINNITQIRRDTTKFFARPLFELSQSFKN